MSGDAKENSRKICEKCHKSCRGKYSVQNNVVGVYMGEHTEGGDKTSEGGQTRDCLAKVLVE